MLRQVAELQTEIQRQQQASGVRADTTELEFRKYELSKQIAALRGAPV
jgi:hypothetical protein